jgi:hypothetical protein
LTHAADINQINDTAYSSLEQDEQEQEQQKHTLYLDSNGGILSGSVGSLNKFVTPRRKQSSSSSSSTSSSTASSASSEFDTNGNAIKKPTEVNYKNRKN